MYTVKQIANILQCNPETIKRYIYRGKLKAVKVGKNWKISEEELQRIKENGI